MKKNMHFLMLFVGSVLLFSCSKNTPMTSNSVDPRDKFVGTWVGWEMSYQGSTFLDSTVTTFTIKKDSFNTSKIIIGVPVGIGSFAYAAPATVNGNDFIVTNYIYSNNTYSYLSNCTGTISGDFINYNGTNVETNISTGIVTNVTIVGRVSK